jgi:hypothetical protein
MSPWKLSRRRNLGAANAIEQRFRPMFASSWSAPRDNDADALERTQRYEDGVPVELGTERD